MEQFHMETEIGQLFKDLKKDDTEEEAEEED
jgi:hypothetical protein